MKKNNHKQKISITLDPKIIEMMDDKTNNRSTLIDWLLKEYFNSIEIGRAHV